MDVGWPEIGVCGLSCRLCPMYHSRGESRCGGCKSESRMSVGCSFITCAVKKKGIEFCWDCQEGATCDRWRNHRESGRHVDSFVCYQRLEDNIRFVQENGVQEFQREQLVREGLLREMLRKYNEGRSKTFYCIASTVMETGELESALIEAKKQSAGSDVKQRAKTLHRILEKVATRKNYCLKLRK